MPPQKVRRREQGAAEVDRHLAAAAEDIAIAESGDAEGSAYEHAADHIIAAQELNPTLSFAEIDRRLGKANRKSRYSSELVQWRRDPRGRATPYSGPTAQNRASDRAKVNRAARERPADFAAAFEQAPPDAKRKIAEQIGQAPEVRIAARQADQRDEERRRPSPVPPRTDHMLYQAEGKLATAERSLRDFIAVINEIDQPGDDDDVIDRLDRIEQLAQAAREGYTTGKSIDTWALELYEEHERSGE